MALCAMSTIHDTLMGALRGGSRGRVQGVRNPRFLHNFSSCEGNGCLLILN